MLGNRLLKKSLTSAFFSPSSHSITAYLVPGLPSLSLFPAWPLASSHPLSLPHPLSLSPITLTLTLTLALVFVSALPRSLSVSPTSHSSLLSQSSLSNLNQLWCLSCLLCFFVSKPWSLFQHTPSWQPTFFVCQPYLTLQSSQSVFFV